MYAQTFSISTFSSIRTDFGNIFEKISQKVPKDKYSFYMNFIVILKPASTIFLFF